MKLNKRSTMREAVFQFVIEYKRLHDGNPPSTPEIAQACAISPATAYYHLTKLDAEQRIRIGGERRCMIEVVGGQWAFKSTQSPEENQDSRYDGESKSENNPSRKQLSKTTK